MSFVQQTQLCDFLSALSIVQQKEGEGGGGDKDKCLKIVKPPKQ